MIDDAEAPTTPVIRLTNRETMRNEREAKPVRLVTHPDETGTSQRLTLPSREEIELRTHQPGIEDILETTGNQAAVMEEDWGGSAIHRHPVPWGWFVLIGLAITGAALWSLTRLETADTRADRIRSETRSALVHDEEEKQEAARLVDSIDATIRDFTNATTVETLSRLVRHPGRVTPMMRGHYADRSVYCGPLKSIQMLQPLTLDDRGNFWLAAVVLADDKVHSLIVETGGDGGPKVDWETFVCHQPVKWDDFAMQRPAGMALDFRVQATRDHFYNHEFSDADQWVCFRLTALDSEETLFGYARTDSAEARELLAALESESAGGTASVILRLRVPENSRSRRAVVIEKVPCKRWIYVDPPDPAS
jgi:hypothetical protein